MLRRCFAFLQGNLEAEQAEARKREKAERKKQQEEERKQAEEEAAAAKASPCSYLLCYVAYCQTIGTIYSGQNASCFSAG